MFEEELAFEEVHKELKASSALGLAAAGVEVEAAGVLLLEEELLPEAPTNEPNASYEEAVLKDVLLNEDIGWEKELVVLEVVDDDVLENKSARGSDLG